MGKVGSKLLVYAERVFSQKLISIAYVYLESPIILQHFKQIIRPGH